MKFDEMKCIFLILINQFNINEFKKFMEWLDEFLNEYKINGHNCLGNHKFNLNTTSINDTGNNKKCENCQVNDEIFPATTAPLITPVLNTTQHQNNNDKFVNINKRKLFTSKKIIRLNRLSQNIKPIISSITTTSSASTLITTAPATVTSTIDTTLDEMLQNNKLHADSSGNEQQQQQNFLYHQSINDDTSNDSDCIIWSTAPTNNTSDDARNQNNNNNDINDIQSETETISDIALIKNTKKLNELQCLDLNLEVSSVHNHNDNTGNNWSNNGSNESSSKIVKTHNSNNNVNSHDVHLVTLKEENEESSNVNNTTNNNNNENDDEFYQNLDFNNCQIQRQPHTPTDNNQFGVNIESNNNNTEDDNMTDTNKRKRRGKAFTATQKFELEKLFSSKKYISSDERLMLAQRLELTQVQIKDWFKNHRKLMRRSLNKQLIQESYDVNNITPLSFM